MAKNSAGSRDDTDGATHVDSVEGFEDVLTTDGAVLIHFYTERSSSTC